MKPIIAITIGDFNGIGPEVALKAAMHPAVRRICRPVLVGPLNVFQHTQRALRIRGILEKAMLPLLKQKGTPVLDVGDGVWADVQFGKVSKAAGKNAGVAIERAVELCLKHQAHAMVTAPISKEALHLAGYNFPGQTEMIAILSRSQRVAMMLVSDALKVGLVTIHVPLRDVPSLITKEKVIEKVQIVHEALKRQFNVGAPRIAVLALNPHAGEGGHIGDEEQSLVHPALEHLNATGIPTDGPFPADAFFGTKSFKRYDAVIAMYHDQGLIPLKMLSMGKAVNFSAGLNIIRTSPDHGTAFDIAGKGKADVSSMIEAIRLAVTFTND